MKWILRILLAWFVLLGALNLLAIVSEMDSILQIIRSVFNPTMDLISITLSLLVSSFLCLALGWLAILSWNGSQKNLRYMAMCLAPQLVAINHTWNLPLNCHPGDFSYHLYQWDFAFGKPKFFIGPMFDVIGGIHLETGSQVREFGPGIYLNLVTLVFFLFVSYICNFASIQSRLNNLWRKIRGPRS